jgi:hypothetical protein
MSYTLHLSLSKLNVDVDAICEKASEDLKERWKFNILKEDLVASRTYLDSIKVERVSRGVWAVYTDVEYAPYLEFGTHPMEGYLPPLEPLVEWVQEKFGLEGKAAYKVAHVIRLKIADEGQEPKPCAREALNTSRNVLRRQFKK